jgi:hypothetical protein
MGELRVRVEKIGPWFLRAAALLRVVVLAVSGFALYQAGGAGLALASVLALSAVGVWFRRVWPWRAAVVLDIAAVIFFAAALIDSGETSSLRLFAYIAGTVTADIVLLGLGEAALARPQWPPMPEQLPQVPE